jgi:hypothetical protein
MRIHPLRLATLSLALAAALPSAAAPQPILDYRKPTAERPPTVSAQTRAILARAMMEATGKKTVVVLGHVRGAFSAAGGSDDLYLVADKGPVAAEPFPEGQAQLLVAIRDGRTAVYKLPADIGYQRIAGTVDTDRDGRGEVLLETASYNMGQSVNSVDLVALGTDGGAAIRQSLEQVAYDGCDNPVGKREKSASTVALGDDGKLVATPHSQRCR